MKLEKRVPCAGRIRWAMVWFALTAVPVFGQQPVAAFPSPGDAVQRLVQAVQSNDTGAIEKVLGGPTDLASCRDDDQDRVDRQTFLKKYQEMHRLHREPDGTVALYIGAENWPFPIPLVQQGGAWRFDTEAGAKEVLYRRIGENEVNAIEMCREILAGHKPASGAEVNGYYFRVFTSPAGNSVTAVAYPAEYRLSGVMTFVATGNNVVYEKDLGANTPAAASALSTFRKDASWHAVVE